MITLKTLPEATEQEVFDQVARHLLTQNERATDGGCAYRVERLCGVPLMCAAGCLISQAEYDAFEEDIEGMNWCDNVMAGRFPPQHMYFIEGLQKIHDGREAEYWPMDLINFAVDHELNAQVIQEVLAARAALP